MVKTKQFKLVVNGIDLSELPICEYALEHVVHELTELNLRIIGADVHLIDGTDTKQEGNKKS